MKQCYRCLVTKEAEHFYKSNASKDGLRSSCIFCETKKEPLKEIRCVKCGEWFMQKSRNQTKFCSSRCSLNYFSQIYGRSKKGFIRSAVYRRENREKMNEKSKRSYLKNREKVILARKKYRETHRERIRRKALIHYYKRQGREIPEHVFEW